MIKFFLWAKNLMVIKTFFMVIIALRVVMNKSCLVPVVSVWMGTDGHEVVRTYHVD